VLESGADIAPQTAAVEASPPSKPTLRPSRRAG